MLSNALTHPVSNSLPSTTYSARNHCNKMRGAANRIQEKVLRCGPLILR